VTGGRRSSVARAQGGAGAHERAVAATAAHSDRTRFLAFSVPASRETRRAPPPNAAGIHRRGRAETMASPIPREPSPPAAQQPAFRQGCQLACRKRFAPRALPTAARLPPIGVCPGAVLATSEQRQRHAGTLAAGKEASEPSAGTQPVRDDVAKGEGRTHLQFKDSQQGTPTNGEAPRGANASRGPLTNRSLRIEDSTHGRRNGNPNTDPPARMRIQR